MKKGQSTLSPIAKIFLGLIVVVVVVWGFSGGAGRLYAAVRGQAHIPGQQNQTGQANDFGLMKEPLKKLTEKINLARESGTKSGCIVYLETLPSDFDGYNIYIQRYSEGTDIYLEKDGIKRRFSTIERMYPCAVYGIEGADNIGANFFSNWLSGARCPSCKKDYKEVNEIIFTANDEFTINGVEYSTAGIPYLYKAAEGNACFFVTHAGGLFGSCHGDEEGLGNDCMSKIQASIPVCAAATITTTTTTTSTTTSTTTNTNLCAEYSNANGGGFNCQDIANCGFTRDSTGLSQCDASPAKCIRNKCSGDIYNVCCKR